MPRQRGWVGRGLSCPLCKGQRRQGVPPGYVLENCVSFTSNGNRHSCWGTGCISKSQPSIRSEEGLRWKNFAFFCKLLKMSGLPSSRQQRLSKNPIRGSSWLFGSFQPLCLPSKVKQRSRHTVTFSQSSGEKKSKQQAIE